MQGIRWKSTARETRDDLQGRCDREPRHGRAHAVPRDLRRHERRVRSRRGDRAAERLRRRRAHAPVPDGAVRDRVRNAGLQGGRRGDRGRPRRDGGRPAEELAQVLECGRDRGGLRLRGAARAAVRATARDDVRPRERRPDEPEGDAEPAPPRRDRERALRRRAPALPAGLAAEGGPADGRSGSAGCSATSPSTTAARRTRRRWRSRPGPSVNRAAGV